jgi:hypothetical protein
MYFASITISKNFLRLTFKMFKLLKFLKVLKKFLKSTTCFGQYGHPQMLKYLVGETSAISCTPSTTYVHIEGTHEIAAVSPTKYFNI